MAFTVYLKLVQKDGTLLKGEVKTEGHIGWIKVLSFHWGVVNNTKAWEDGRNAYKVPKDFSIVKNVDSTSPILFNICAFGDPLNSFTLELVKADRGKETVYAKYEGKTTYVSGVRPGGSSGSDDPLEEVAFNTEGLKYSYGDPKDAKAAVQSSQGGPKVTGAWKISPSQP